MNTEQIIVIKELKKMLHRTEALEKRYGIVLNNLKETIERSKEDVAKSNC